MKRVLYIGLLLVTFLSVIGCNKEDKSVIKLSTKSVSFDSKGGIKDVSSNGKGFELVVIMQDGKVISERTSKGNSLLLTSNWLNVWTPGVSQGEMAHMLRLEAKPNNSFSKRECKVVVKNGKEQISISVSQEMAK